MKKTWSWVYKLLLFIVCILFGFIFFLFRPQYFINDLEGKVKTKISESIQAKLDFDCMQGNLIEGFSFNNVQFNYSDSIRFFAEDILIKPALSFYALGKFDFINIVIKNADFHYALPVDQFNLSEIYYSRNFEIASIKILKSSIIYDGREYKIDGHFSFRCNQQINIQFQDFSIDASFFDSKLTIASGSISYFLNKLAMNNIKLKSTWIHGDIDFTINLNNYSKSISNIYIEMVDVHIKNTKELMIRNFTFDMEKSLTFMIDKISYPNLEISDIEINGDINNNLILANYSFTYLDNHYINRGEISFDTLSWEAVLNFDDFEMDNKTNISGLVKVNGPYCLDSINIAIDLHNSLLDSIRFNSIFGELKVSSDKDINGQIEIDSKMKLEYCIFYSYLCFNFNFLNSNYNRYLF